MLSLVSCTANDARRGPGDASVVAVTTNGTDDGAAGVLDDGGADGAPDGPSLGASYGPDPALRMCDLNVHPYSTQCPSPPSVCLDARFAVNYLNGNCVSGACTWQKVDNDCARYDGGTCIGGPADAAVTSPVDGGLLGAAYGCAVPLGPAPAPPAIACDVDASADAASCPLPPSVCVRASPGFLLYYDNSECVSGQCVWQVRSHACPYGCYAGACSGPPTAPVVPPPN